MPRHLPAKLVDAVLARHPLPIADAVAALVSAESLHEERDRVVEVFRATVRYLAVLALSTRMHFGAAAGSEQLDLLLVALRRRGLTDGQWVALCREVLRPAPAQPARHPLGELVRLLHQPGARLPGLLDGLLEMRKSETVAHGGTGDGDEIAPLLVRRMPQLADLLELLDPLWAAARLVLPSASPEGDEPQRGRLLMGCTPPRGRWRRIELSPGARLPPGEPLLIDPEGRPILSLSPLALVRRGAPDGHEEFFALDGGSRRGALYVAFPSMAEHHEPEGWEPLERAMRAFEGDKGADPEPEARRPYRGLESFGPEHAALFFGREEQAEALANRVRRAPMLTVTGPSGSGKSSLLSAGVLPRLADFIGVAMRPGTDPCLALARRLAHALGEPADAESIEQVLRRRPQAAGQALARWSAGRGRSLVLLVDQAEELFTLCSSQEQRLAFARALCSIGVEADGPLRVVLVVREDFFARLATLAPLQGVYNRAVEVVTTPDREALRRTLVLPARRFGYRFDDPALVEAMLDRAEGEPAALGLLQFCADRLWDGRDRRWKRITTGAYEALGGVEGALAAHAEKTLQDLTPSQREAARALLLRLVTAEGSRALASRAELLSGAERREDAEVVLERLVASRLVVAREAESPAEDASLELVHEALLRHWERLRTWLAEDREGQRRLHALRQAARVWQARGRPKGLLWRGEVLVEHRLWRRHARPRLTDAEAAFLESSEADESRARRLRAALLGAGCAWLALFAVVMFLQREQAVSARAQAERAREQSTFALGDAERAREQATAALAQSEVGRLLAEAGRRESLGRPGEALALLRAAASASEGFATTPERARQEGELARLEGLGEASIVLQGAAAPVVTVSFDAAGERVLSAAGDDAWIWDARGRSGVRLAHPATVWIAEGSPDGARVATACSDRRLRLWDARTGALIAELAPGAPALAIAFSSRGALAVGAADGKISLLDPATGALLRTIESGEAVLSAAFSPGGDRLATGHADRRARLWDPLSGAPLGALGPASAPVRKLAFSPDGRALAALHQKSVTLFDVATRERARTLAGHDELVSAISFSPDSGRLATGSSDRTARVWDARSGALLQTLSGHERGVSSVAFSPDGARLATGSLDGVVRLWDAHGFALLRALHGHPGGVSALAFSPDGGRLVSGSKADDGVARVWETSGGARSLPLRGHRDDIYALAFSPDGARLATGSRDHSARLWDAASGAALAVLEHRDAVYAVDFSPSGELLATGSHDRTARIWEARSGRLLHTLEGHAGYLPAVAFSPDGRRLATGSVDRRVMLWDVASGALSRTLSGQEGAVFALGFDASGETLASLADDGTLFLWDTAAGVRRASLPAPAGYAEATARRPGRSLLAFGASDGGAVVWNLGAGAAVTEVRGHAGATLSVALSADGRLLATGSSDQTACVWEVAGGALRRSLGGHGGAVLSLAFSPDGALVATGSADRSVRIFRVADGQLLSVLAGHDDKVTALAFSPDGASLASASADDTARLWAVDPSSDARSSRLATGARTNLRVCRASGEVIAVLPFPEPSSVFAPAALCEPAPPLRQTFPPETELEPLRKRSVGPSPKRL